VETISGLLPLGIETRSLEVDKPESDSAVKKQVEELTGGRLDILANNAGRNSSVPALDVDFDEVLSTFEVNIFAVIRMCQEFAPLLIEVNDLFQGCVLPKT
jgi:1-acylglycerone phosphate reductase